MVVKVTTLPVPLKVYSSKCAPRRQLGQRFLGGKKYSSQQVQCVPERLYLCGMLLQNLGAWFVIITSKICGPGPFPPIRPHYGRDQSLPHLPDACLPFREAAGRSHKPALFPWLLQDGRRLSVL